MMRKWACDGLLFNNIYGMPMTVLPAGEVTYIADALENIIRELSGQESSREEMIRTYLKQMIIRATRVWKQQQLKELRQPHPETSNFSGTSAASWKYTSETSIA